MSRATSSQETGPNAHSGPPGPRTQWVMIARISLLLLVAGGAVAGLVLGRRPSRGAVPGAANYFCPMHREIGSPDPGSCPVCGMALQPRDVARASTVASELTTYEVRVARVHKTAEPIRVPARVDAGGMVVALFHRDQLAALAPDERASFSTGAAPGVVVAVVRGAQPPATWDDDTVQVRFSVDGPGPAPAVGVAGWIDLAARKQALMTVPEGAVLRSGEGPYVLVASANDRLFTKRAVGIGRVYFGNVVVTTGLAAGERVVTRKAFFLDAERRLRDPAAAAVEVTP